MDHPACIVMTSASTEDEAEALAAALVEARLAACVQVQRVRSFYIWEEALHREPEWVLLIKTLAARYPALEAFIRERHSYETPEIVQLPVSAGSPDYLRWLGASSTGLDQA
ncbi:Divalent-cation tolerance protein CutA [Variovorax sp. PBS-H4]|uniref:divalent-cation tolerance protein CutA n=1 Tax=Variovorax sp. PBS-H4 TaxID=434008 RepID=UPI001317903F|nr:divalent-cation tolerance protein CutA [Variovorax sp. PBS-H4]VTU40679.1 Divalent-cation tolerance protein CutA [Variovorax sp. PBS-H4]